jgi:hypothetical protein
MTDPAMERDPYLCVWSDSPANAAAFFGLELGVTARVEVQDRSDRQGRVLYHVRPIEEQEAR